LPPIVLVPFLKIVVRFGLDFRRCRCGYRRGSGDRRVSFESGFSKMG
jgi:hypothetical protein